MYAVVLWLHLVLVCRGAQYWADFIQSSGLPVLVPPRHQLHPRFIVFDDLSLSQTNVTHTVLPPGYTLELAVFYHEYDDLMLERLRASHGVATVVEFRASTTGLPGQFLMRTPTGIQFIVTVVYQRMAYYW